MTSRLREDPLALAQWSNEVARVTRIPLAHVVKDFWITEALRAMASSASEQSVLLVFKGGTGAGPAASRDEYSRRVVGGLIWPGHPQPTFDECLARIQGCAQIL
jgi:hypothetical protein